LLGKIGKAILCRSRAIRAPEFASAFSRTIQVMLSKGDPPMSPDYRSASSAEPVDYDDIAPPSNWRERAVTVVATSIAVLIVAVVAVLMGMA